MKRGRAQAVIRRAKAPAGLSPLLLQTEGPDGFDRPDLLARLARRTPLPRLNGKTVWQAEDEATREGGCPHFRIIMELLASPDRQDHKEALAITDRLWRDVKNSLHGMRDPAMKRRALRPLTKFRCSFLVED